MLCTVSYRSTYFNPFLIGSHACGGAGAAVRPRLRGTSPAAPLGYKDTINALKAHVDPEDKSQDDGVTIRDSIGREQHPTIINESGLYSLVLSDASCPLATPQSVLPVLCVLFRVWVFPVKRPPNGRTPEPPAFPKLPKVHKLPGHARSKAPALPKTGEAGALPYV